MLLLTHTEPEFTKLIQEQTPRIATMKIVQDLMKKYTAGYLTPKRLAAAVGVVDLPMVALGEVGGGASGEQSGDNIMIDTNYFKGYKEGHSTYVKLVPITVFHELAHWGYWKGQQEGHPSDEFGREHNNHGEYMSPLNAQMIKLFDALATLRLMY